ncbi:hypothetical protein BV898_16985 [Hypsibius exemplaris]|uniref:CAS1 domain-containing protein 1 n=1 Tax=Hypsibius exemplaris TaxID=2072580 RepID=A0A9X6RLL2_HYPEX|nr:hypothetical protein BV898_16985 [Hypsibius exemplaris]
MGGSQSRVRHWHRLGHSAIPIRIALLTAIVIIFMSLRKTTTTYLEKVYYSATATDDNCSRLFQSGSLKWNLREGTSTWRPRDCELRYRSLNDSVKCMGTHGKSGKRRYIVFIGDSRVKQLRDGMVLALTGQDYDALADRTASVDPIFRQAHEAFQTSGSSLVAAGARLRFDQHEYLDDGDGGLTELIRNLTTADEVPSLVVLGVGAWQIRQCHRGRKPQNTCAQHYSQQFRKLLPLLQELAQTTDVLWLPQGALREHFLRDGNHVNAGFTNHNMIKYNNEVRRVLGSEQASTRKVVYWQSAWETSLMINDGLDGFHYGYNSKHVMTQMLMDWICHPYEGDPELNANRPNSNYCCMLNK